MEFSQTYRTKKRQRIAVIGAGISGLGAAWLLSKNFDVVLFESTGQLGGHARTVSVTIEDKLIPVDIGFIVFNMINYPNLCQLFKLLGVAIHKSNMSFGVSINSGEFEYACRSWKALLAQPSNVFKPAFWKMLRDILKFFRTSMNDIQENPQISVQELTSQRGYGSWFLNRYLLPMSGAIWSTPRSEMLKFPAEAMIRFFDNHGLLSLSGQHQWWTVTGGSQNYISMMVDDMKTDIRLNSQVDSVVRNGDNVNVKVVGQDAETFDSVIFACHSDTALGILQKATPTENQILGNISYQKSKIVLHTDEKLMPKRRACWSSWVYLANSNADEEHASVTYWMNSLQGIPKETPLFATLNPPVPVDEKHVLIEQPFEHPRYDFKALKALGELPSIQGKANTWYCGAWTGMGFHEDGFSSAIRVAKDFGVVPPWD